MNIEWNFKTIALIVLAALVLVGTNVGQYFVLWGPKQKAITVKYDNEVAVLQATIDKVGPLVGIWTIKDGIEGISPGKKVEESDLTVKEIPESFITQSFILDPESIIGKYYRVGISAGTPLSNDLVMVDPMDDTTREFDVVSSVMPIGLKIGDYVDYRIVYPLGEDFIVLPHKRVEAINDKTIKIKLKEDEIHYYQASLIDYFLQSDEGATLYLSKYVEPGIQKAAIPYYAVPKNILAIMIADPNIIKKVNAAINGTTRTIIDSGVSNVSPEDGAVIAAGRDEIAGKIDGGSSQLKSEEQANKDAIAKENAALPVPTPVPTQAPPASSEPLNKSTDKIETLPTPPTLNIGKGVVE
ncbi:SAF domain-containing protein [Paenibacillus psychroresistens]|uniref:SAF domain-containing protein n=1 Tax=Paenibacillus psychroresistens TaxID=1778678 RepID=UPI001390A796|nr:SAF domain-containing protein [Paenibacillus psychroresistens]